MTSKKMFLAAALVVFAASGNAFAFHDGGVAYCDGCHTMHNSSGGKKMTVNNLPTGTANTYLLQGSDQSSTCLKCHSKNDTAPTSYHIATYPAPAAGIAPSEMTPGGDFAWLLKSYTWSNSYGGTGSSPGERHGHNIVAADFGFVPDSTLANSPGGSYPAANLACSSCHDPHGKYRQLDAAGTTIAKTGKPTSSSGSYGALPTATEAVGVYRLLAGNGYLPDSLSATPGVAFTNDSPIAVAPSTYNRSEATTDTRVAYGKNMSEWCSNCHAGLHNDAYPTNLRHPAGNGATLTSDVVNNYNTYKASGDLTNTIATAYTSMVPFEEGTTDLATLASHAVNDGSQTNGASTSNNVMCLSCHRAHASGWDSMTRWNQKSEFLTVAGSYPGIDATTTEGQAGQYNAGKTMAEVQATFYGRPASAYATYQRSLCNKCHAKD